jgi:titin
MLEDRALPSAYVVTTTADGVPGSLRDAINQVNAGHYNQIDFNLPWNDPGHVYYQGSVGNVQPVPAASASDADLTDAAPHWTHSWWSIQPTSYLPFITNAVTINGWTQPGFAGSPLVELNGSQAGAASGMEIDSTSDTMSVTVCGLDINSFSGNGLLLYNRYTNSGNDVVEGCYIGTDVSGTARMPNGLDGIVAYTSSNRIGTNGDGVNDAAEGNLISGNNGQGVVLGGAGATGNVIAGNRIGTDVTGTQALPNAQGGIALVSGPSNNIIGTSGHDIDNAGERNLISGNNLNFAAGIVTTPGCINNMIAGNYIGTDVTGTLSLPNAGGGVNINGDYTFIGTDATGFATAATRNVISGNGFMGIGIGSNHNLVAGNFIGTDPTGMVANPNGGYGILMLGGWEYNQIGTNGDGVNDAAEGNVLCDTFIDVLMGSNAYNVFAGNKIGTDVTGMHALCRNFAGFDIGSGSHDNRIGVNAADSDPTAERNVISGHAGYAIYDEGPGVYNNVIAGNYIGTDITGENSLGDGHGVHLGGDHNRIGTTSDATANPVEGNVIDLGIELHGSGAIGNVVAGNDIGTNATGTVALPDAGGVELDGGASDNTIGGTTPAARNVIARDVGLVGSGTSGNVVEGNYLGTDVTGTIAFNGPFWGVGIGDGATNNTIGGTSSGEGNTIAFYHTAGVADIFGPPGTGNSILGNSIHDNGGPGILLEPGANNDQAAPVLTTAYATSGATIVIGTLAGTPNTTTNYHLEFFANPATDPEGQTPLGSWSGPITFNAGGQGSFTTVLPAAPPAGQGLVTATATDPGGDTSAFSAGVTATLLPPSSLCGNLFKDFNEDGFQDFGELGLGGVTVQLTGTDFIGRAVSLSAVTAASGYYQFPNLLPGTYTVSVPGSLTVTKVAVGLNGSPTAVVGNGNSSPGLAIALGTTMNVVTFGVEPAAGDALHRGQTAGIGFWNNRNGQALIKSLNGGGTAGSATQLGTWLADTFHNMFGSAGANLAGQNNAQVAAYFQVLFATRGDKLEAQVLATALSVYVTNSTLAGGTFATSYGFTVAAGGGTGLATFNVGTDGAAVNHANGTTLTIMDILIAADQDATHAATAAGFVLYAGDQTDRSLADDLFGRINDLGGI